LRDLAAKLIRSGTSGGAAVNQLRSLMHTSTAPRDQRWQVCFDSVPRLVESAEQKLREPETPTQPVTPCAIGETLEVFQQWLAK
jgi:hypothetical protein